MCLTVALDECLRDIGDLIIDHATRPIASHRMQSGEVGKPLVEASDNVGHPWQHTIAVTTRAQPQYNDDEGGYGVRMGNTKLLVTNHGNYMEAWKSWERSGPTQAGSDIPSVYPGGFTGTIAHPQTAKRLACEGKCDNPEHDMTGGKFEYTKTLAYIAGKSALPDQDRHAEFRKDYLEKLGHYAGRTMKLKLASPIAAAQSGKGCDHWGGGGSSTGKENFSTWNENRWDDLVGTGRWCVGELMRGT